MAVTVSDISARARRLDREQTLSLLVVDYIQLIQGRQEVERREQQVADISRSLKLLAKDLDIPVIALSQLNRGPEIRPNKRPQLADLRESGAIEQDADVVMLLYREEYYNPETERKNICEIDVAKNRTGPTKRVDLAFIKEYTRFENLSSQPPSGSG